MKLLKAEKTLEIPSDVNLAVKSRKVRVKGARGVLTRDFSHVPLDLHVKTYKVKGKDGKEEQKKQLVAEMWFGDRLQLATIRTVMTHIRNMITGVRKGYLFKMRTVHAHFPIGLNIEKDGSEVEVRNYLGEKKARKVAVRGDVIAKRSEDVKDQIEISGNNLEDVAQTAANIWRIARVADKDIRKFLDGVYVSHKGNVVEDS